MSHTVSGYYGIMTSKINRYQIDVIFTMQSIDLSDSTIGNQAILKNAVNAVSLVGVNDLIWLVLPSSQ